MHLATVWMISISLLMEEGLNMRAYQNANNREREEYDVNGPERHRAERRWKFPDNFHREWYRRDWDQEIGTKQLPFWGGTDVIKKVALMPYLHRDLALSPDDVAALCRRWRLFNSVKIRRCLSYYGRQGISRPGYPAFKAFLDSHSNAASSVVLTEVILQTPCCDGTNAVTESARNLGVSPPEVRAEGHIPRRSNTWRKQECRNSPQGDVNMCMCENKWVQWHGMISRSLGRVCYQPCALLKVFN